MALCTSDRHVSLCIRVIAFSHELMAMQLRGDNPHGDGHMTYSDKACILLVLPDGNNTKKVYGGEYDGRWANGERYGKGRLRFKGTPFKGYDGDWEADVMCGTGKLVWRSGSTYVGEFKGGLMWGRGTYEHVDESEGETR